MPLTHTNTNRYYMRTVLLCFIILITTSCSTYQLTIDREVTSQGTKYGTIGINLNSWSDSYYITDKNYKTTLRLQGKPK